MTVVQLFLLELCVRYYPWTVQLPTPITHSRPPSRPSSRNSHNNSNNSYTIPTTMSRQGSDHITTRASRYHSQGWYKKHAIYWGTHFWNWPTIWPYYIFLAFFTLFVGLSLLIIGKTEFYVGLLGLAALGIESTVPMPQAIQNYQSKSTAGFSPAILLMWVVGDSFKTYYYITTGAKYQFIGCGIIQLCVDCVIIIQTIIYSKYWKGAARRRYHASAVEEGRGGGKGRGRGLGQLGDYFLTGWPWSQDRTGSTQVNDRSSSEALLAGNGEDDDDNDDEILPYRHQPSHHH
ncbi:hypothetical protein BX616_005439 [Lobosporangium transversale]|nr:hypothetical protein BX616_005439 [Lobosporangium transversale]